MQIIDFEKSSKIFHDPEILRFADVFPAELWSFLTHNNFLYDDRDFYIRAGEKFWKYESRMNFVPVILSKEKYLDLSASTKEFGNTGIVQINDDLYIPIYCIGNDVWEEIGTPIHTPTTVGKLLTVMIRNNFWFIDKEKQQVHVYRRKLY